jgi:hypothetical protein
MLDGKGLLVSLPATELNGFAPSGSLFGVEELRKVTLSEELRSAIDIAAQLCAKRRAPLLLSTRPEMFTHGASLAWLKDRIGGTQDHLIISDGSAIRPISDMRNHLFLYRTGIVANARAFARLAKHVPEIIATMHSQVNTGFAVRLARKAVTPRPWLLQAQTRPAKDSAARYYPYVHDVTLDACLQRTLAAAPTDTMKQSLFRHLTYIPLTEAACADRVTVRSVAQLIHRAHTQPGYGVLLRTPSLEGIASPREAAIKKAIEFVLGAGLKKATPVSQVLFVTEDPTPKALAGLSAVTDLVLPQSFAYWRHSPEYYAHFKKLAVLGSKSAAAQNSTFTGLLATALARRPTWV